MTALFIGLITFVAGLNILVVLAMTVSDRARDIAVLMAMGARREQVRRVFVLLGLAVGGFGTAAGLIAGYALAWAAGRYQLDTSGSAGLFGAFRAVSSQWRGCVVDRRGGAGDQRWGYFGAGRGRRPGFSPWRLLRYE